MDTSSIPGLLTARLRTDGDKPLITSYDLITGERTELSVATADNWVSKTANYLAEEFDIAPGDPVGLLMGMHWVTPVLLLACWRVGAVPVVDLGGRETLPAAPVTFFIEDRAEEVVGLAGELVAVGRGMGARLSGAASGAEGLRLFAEEVLAFADDYDDPAVDGRAPAWAAPPLSQAPLLQRVSDWPRRARVLTTVPAGGLDGALALLAAVSREGSLVLVRADVAADLGQAVRRITQDERATHLHLRPGVPQPV